MVAIMVIVLILILYFNNDIGLRRWAIEKDARISHEIPDDWEVTKSITDNIYAMIFYDKDLNNHTFSIYENRKGPSFGYFFRGGGSMTVEDNDIAEYQVEGCQERIYLSINKQQIIKVEIDKGDIVETINIDADKPFALILPNNIRDIKFYNMNNMVVQPILQSL